MDKNKNKNKKEKYVGLGTSLEKSFVLYNHAVFIFVTSNKHETACCCHLVRRRQQGKPSTGVLLKRGSRFLMTFIIGVKSYMRA